VNPPTSTRGRMRGVVAAFVALWFIAVAARFLYLSLPRTNPFSIRDQAAVVFFFASLACCAVAAFWIMQPPRRCVGLKNPPRLPRWNLVRLLVASTLSLGLLWAFLTTSVSATLHEIGAAPKLLIPGLVLSALAEEVFFREALPSAVFDYVSKRFSVRSTLVCAVLSLVVSQGLCAAGHLTPSWQLISADPDTWHSAAWILGSNFAFGSLMLINWWAGARLAERVVIHTAANLAIVLVPTGVIVGIWRSSMFCAIGFLLPTAAFVYEVVRNIVRYPPTTTVPTI